MNLTSNGLPTHTELSEILSYISPDSYEIWYKVFICCGRAYNQDQGVFSVCQNWARSYQNRNSQCESQERTAFFKSSQRHGGVNIGWLINEAKRGGYAPKKAYESFNHPVVMGEIKRLPKSLITSKIEGTINSESSSAASNSALELLNNVRAVLSFWVFGADSFHQERAKFLNENFAAFDELVPGASSLYFKALASFCDYLQDPSLFSELKFIEWGTTNIYGFDGAELHALCNVDSFSSFSAGITSPAEANDKFNTAMQNAAMMVTGAKAQLIADLCGRFSSIADPEARSAMRAKVQKAINQLGITINLGDNLLENITGKEVAKISKERTLETFNPNTSKQVYIKTGIPQLDKHVYGYRRGNTTILAAHSGVGKTWYGVDAARNVLKDGGRVVFFSSEMAAPEICQRFTNNVSGVSDETLKDLYERCLSGANNPSQAAKDFSQVFYNVNQFFNEHPNLSIIAGKTGGLSVEQVTQEIALQSQGGPLDLVVVDYLQNLDNETCRPRVQNWERVKNTMEQLNNASRLYNCPILILAQLNKPTRKSSGEAAEPNMYDVAEASAVVRDAAAVLLMYKVQDDADLNAPNVVSADLRLSVAKSRFGRQTSQALRIMRDAGSRFMVM